VGDLFFTTISSQNILPSFEALANLHRVVSIGRFFLASGDCEVAKLKTAAGARKFIRFIETSGMCASESDVQPAIDSSLVGLVLRAASVCCTRC
jgi:hypothetical protein